MNMERQGMEWFRRKGGGLEVVKGLIEKEVA